MLLANKVDLNCNETLSFLYVSIFKTAHQIFMTFYMHVDTYRCFLALIGFPEHRACKVQTIYSGHFFIFNLLLRISER